MRAPAFGVAVVILGGLFSAAQEAAPKVEVFGGYAYFDRDNGLGGVNLNGWNVQGTYNFNRWLGATADFGGYYGSSVLGIVSFNYYTFLFGPTVSLRLPHVTPYAHALFGAAHIDNNFDFAYSTSNPFAMAVGGGLDVPVKAVFGVRPVQVDWVRAGDLGSPAKNILRVSTGVVFRFGE